MNSLWILAAAEGDSAPSTEGVPLPAAGESDGLTNTGAEGSVPPTDPDEMPGFFDNPMNIILMVAMFGFIYFFMIRGPKKKQQDHNKMLNSLKKNDKVCTIGGIYGTVIEVRDREIVIKIDESNNTRMRVMPSAIRNVSTEEREK